MEPLTRRSCIDTGGSSHATKISGKWAMSHVKLTDVEWINLNVLVVIHAGLQNDRAATCSKFALAAQQGELGAGLERLIRQASGTKPGCSSSCSGAYRAPSRRCRLPRAQPRSSTAPGDRVCAGSQRTIAAQRGGKRFLPPFTANPAPKYQSNQSLAQ